ncbi:MAG TPA: class I SAM-dependent rRNA methyltransferase [Anaerolineales bacterium]
MRLKPGREKPVLRRHPWIFSGAIADIDGEPSDGQTVDVIDANATFLAKGSYSSKSQIRVRIWSWDPDAIIDRSFLRGRLVRAIQVRQDLIDPEQTNAYRLVHAESDGIPGLIVDRYADNLVVQSLTSGSEFWLEQIVDLLVEITGIEQIYERSDVEVRGLEGLPPRVRLVRGNTAASSALNQDQSGRVQIEEMGIRYWVDLLSGQKTGFYLDQRENRSTTRQLALGRTVLDCFSYTGAFALSALAGGAKSVTVVEASREALNLARENMALNGYDQDRLATMEGDVFQVLRLFRDQARLFDMIVLDPPKFAPTAAQAQQAARGYKDINLLAFKLLRPGGLLVTFSCSGGVSEELFQKIVAGAALDAQVDAQILEKMFQGPDHPVALNFPEGAYLKGLICRA